MMKIVIAVALSLLLFIFPNYFVHENNDGEWEKVYSDGSFNSILKYDDSYVLAGDGHLQKKGDEVIGQGWLVKTDENGEIIWEKSYGGKGDDSFQKVIKDGKYFILAGSTTSYGKGGCDLWVVKVDEQGNEIWNKTYGSEDDDFLGNLIKTRNGYLLCGVVEEKGCLIKIDKEGMVEWKKYYPEFYWFEDVIETEDGFAVVGDKKDIKNMSDISLIKIDKNGKEIWKKTYGGRDFDTSSCIIDTTDGFLIGGGLGISLTEWRALLIKTDYNGNVEWMKTYGKLREELFKIIEIENGYLFIGGTESAGHGNAWMVKVNKDGEEIWNKSFGGRHSYAIMDILEDNGFYIGCGNIVQEPENKFNAWILKCGDYYPPKIKIVKPRENYLYLFDREVLPIKNTVIIGSITVKAELNDPHNMVNRVEYYLTGPDFYDYEPREIDYSPPYEWEWNGKAFGYYEITVAAYYGNAGAVAVDKIEVYIINPFPLPSASFHK